MSRTEDSCTFNNGLCVCGNTDGSCLHENSTVTYESLSSDSHTVITTCNDCGYVFRDTQGCSAHGITKTFATPISSTTHNEEIRCECGNLRETRENVSCYFVVDGNKCICGNVDSEKCTHTWKLSSATSQSSNSHTAYYTCTSCGSKKSEVTGCKIKKSFYSPLTYNTHYVEIRCADCSNILEIRKTESCTYVIDGKVCPCGNSKGSSNSSNGVSSDSDSLKNEVNELLENFSGKVFGIAMGVLVICAFGSIAIVVLKKKRK